MTDGKVNQGTYRLTSYEWGVMYDALLDAARITGDKRYSDYVSDRVGFLAKAASEFKGIQRRMGSSVRWLPLPILMMRAR